ncbi:MAG: hypothetical protein NUV77_25720, partial [Thermoguttaceae bacterium]|nr:hypothetical protein [Thermoguttaceae bacterium]
MRGFAVVGSLLLVFGGTLGVAIAQVSVSDVVEGMKARESKVRDLDIRYTISETRTDAFYRFEKQDLERRMAQAKRIEQAKKVPARADQHTKAAYGPKEAIPSQLGRAREEFHAYRLLIRGDKLAYEVFDTRSAVQQKPLTVREKAVYTDGLATILEPADKRGSLRRVSRRDAFPYTRIEDLLRLGGMDFTDY